MEDLHWGGQVWNLPGDDSGSKKYRRGCGGVWRRQRLQKKVTTLVARNTNEAVVGFGGSMESGGRFYVGAFGSSHDDVFTFNLVYKYILYNS
jgi:hypothetical protein